MIGFFSIAIGLIIVWLSYKVLVKEIDKGFEAFSEKYPGINDGNTKTILAQFDRMENLVNDLNTTYYEFVSDLEGHYSVHDKELEILQNRLDKMEKDMRSLKNGLMETSKREPKSEGATVSMADTPERRSNGSGRAAKSVVTTESRVASKEPVEEPRAAQGATTSPSNSEATSKLPQSSMKLDLLNLDEKDKETLRSRIVDLRQKGMNLAQIARELDLGVGELQLFLNLNKIR